MWPRACGNGSGSTETQAGASASSLCNPDRCVNLSGPQSPCWQNHSNENSLTAGQQLDKTPDARRACPQLAPAKHPASSCCFRFVLKASESGRVLKAAVSVPKVPPDGCLARLLPGLTAALAWPLARSKLPSPQLRAAPGPGRLTRGPELPSCTPSTQPGFREI